MMNIDIELYKIFYVVAKLKNITKAANELYISQPAVTMSIKKLEDELETTLFVRTKKGVLLTNEGKVLYEYISKAMDNIKIAENKVENLKKLESGTIKIGIGTTLTKYFLLPYLEHFHKLYPNIIINIDTSTTNEILNNLQNGKVDIAIIVAESLTNKEFNIEYSEKIKDIIIANKKFKDEIIDEIDFDNINNYPLILQTDNTSSRKFLDDFMSKNDITLNSAMELASYSLIIEFVKIGMGLGFISKNYVKEELKNKELYEIKTNIKFPERKILVLTKKDYLPSFSTAKLIEIIKNYKV